MKALVLLIILISPICLFSQQIADSTYNPVIHSPAYNSGEGHHNFHTKDGRYQAFSNLLERDGYVVSNYKRKFENKKLKGGNEQ